MRLSAYAQEMSHFIRHDGLGWANKYAVKSLNIVLEYYGKIFIRDKAADIAA